MRRKWLSARATAFRTQRVIHTVLGDVKCFKSNKYDALDPALRKVDIGECRMGQSHSFANKSQERYLPDFKSACGT